MSTIVPLELIDPLSVERLLDSAFGPDRHTRTAYRVRAGTQAVAALSFAALNGETLAGSVQCWPVALWQDSGGVVPLVMVGPVAVEPALQQGGIGRLLMNHALAAAEATGQHQGLVLIGDADYYGRFFGFSAAPTQAWRLPGPVERARLLARGTAVPEGPGELGPRLTVRA